MKRKYIITLFPSLSILMVGCASEKFHSPLEGDEDCPVNLQAEIEQLNVTRANDMGFTDHDKIGVFMVDFENEMPGNLLTEGNHADNIPFVYNEGDFRWDSPTSLFFKDRSTHADFYGYYPYVPVIDDVENIPFSVERNQSTETTADNLSGYEASDLLWAKKSGVAPSSSIINLTFSHILAGIEVNLIEGDGFDDGEWADTHKSVLITETNTNALFNMKTGKATPITDESNVSIIANQNGYEFRAIVIPQTLSAGSSLMSINVGSDSYPFVKDEEFDYISGRLHKFTFEVNKTMPEGTYRFELIDEAVTMWESDPSSHEGLSRAYQEVEVKMGQLLEDALKSRDIQPENVVNLKLTGHIGVNDFFYIRDNMKKIEALNLKCVVIDNGIFDYWNEKNAIPKCALTNAVTLKYLILPDKLKKIGSYAFAGTILEGSLKIPEGVTWIDDWAFTNGWYEGLVHSQIPGGQIFANSNLTGTLELPSTLEYIGVDAFRECDFSGSLILPQSLKYIGSGAFCGCRHFSGVLNFPESLIEMGPTDGYLFNAYEGIFGGMTGIVGNLELPKNLKVVNGFGGLDVSNILFSENAVEIGPNAFRNTKVKGGIVIPDNIVSIGRSAFEGCNADYISLPRNLTRISNCCFRYCRNLGDSLKIPDNTEVIEAMAFDGCVKVKHLVLPANLTFIGSAAFQNCHALQYIHCQAKVPPVLAEHAFNGVAKDNFTVEVPEESVDAYRNAPGWCEFKRISAYRNFVARPSKYNVLNKGGMKEIVLNADAEWEMTECPQWCHIDKSSGDKKTILTLTVDKMAQGSPMRSGKIEFRLKSDGNHKTHINVGQYDYEYGEDQYVELQKATKGAGIDLFLVGDGYDAADISNGLLMKDMKQTMEYFFAVEPYTTYKEYFNVYTGIALSEDSGIENLNKWRNTKFHTVMPQTCEKRISTDWMYAMDYCAEICTPIISKPDPKVGVIILANYNGCDGVTYIGDSFCSVVTKSTECPYPMDGRGLVQHEAGGHGIGWLADEYIYHNELIQKCRCQCPGCGHVAELIADHKIGFGLNVSLSGKYKEVPWSHLIFNPSYGDIVDIFEGGFFHSRGVYRSEINSCMNNNVPYFSTWSRQLIVQRIMKLAGENFSLDEFYAKDKRDFGRDFTTSRSRNAVSETCLHGNPPVFIKDYKFGKKGGRR